MLTIVQVIWAVLMAVWGAFLLRLGNTYGFALLILMVLYAFAIIQWRRGKPWARWACMTPPALVVLITAPGIINNIMLILSGDPLYRDSPGTLVVVGISVVLFIAFPLPLIALLAANRAGDAAADAD